MFRLNPLIFIIKTRSKKSFNTSNVSVEFCVLVRFLFVKILVSILQMFRLNEALEDVIDELMSVSILQMFRLNRCFLPLYLLSCCGFNTSNVSVEWKMNFLAPLILIVVSILQMFRLNLYLEIKPNGKKTVSILQMFRLNTPHKVTTLS